MAIDVHDLIEYSEAAFMNTDPGPVGSMCLLISGNFTTSWLNKGHWDPNNWKFNNPSNPHTVNLSTKSSVVGLTLSNLDNNLANNLTNFKMCERLVFTTQIGKGEQDFVLDILEKRFFPGYTYFRVSASLDPNNSQKGVKVYFISASIDGNDVYDDYVSKDVKDFRAVGLSPYFNAEETSNFNPVINNVSENVKNSRTKLVEGIYDVVLVRNPLEALDKTINGESASRSVAVTDTYDGEDATGLYDPSVDKNINGMGTGWFSSVVLRERCTVPARIPDSFYTQITNISGRYLGSKNNLYTKYIGHKEDFTEKNLSILSASIRTGSGVNIVETGKDRVFFEAVSFTGSVFPSGSLEEAIAVIGLSDMNLSVLAFAQEVQYVFSGSRQSLYIPRIESLPTIGNILYADVDCRHRLTETRVYSPDLNAILTTDDKGHVIDLYSISSNISINGGEADSEYPA